jgi:hypothetical protein
MQQELPQVVEDLQDSKYDNETQEKHLYDVEDVQDSDSEYETETEDERLDNNEDLQDSEYDSETQEEYPHNVEDVQYFDHDITEQEIMTQGVKEPANFHPGFFNVDGYPTIASQMDLVPTTAIFRTFNALNMRNLLYLQSELTYLENRLSEYTREDAMKNDENSNAHAWNFISLMCDADSNQYKTVMQIRTKLKEYSE